MHIYIYIYIYIYTCRWDEFDVQTLLDRDTMSFSCPSEYLCSCCTLVIHTYHLVYMSIYARGDTYISSSIHEYLRACCTLVIHTSPRDRDISSSIHDLIRRRDNSTRRTIQSFDLE